MSNFVQRLDLSAHSRLEKSLGYQASNRWVAWHWEPEINQLTYTDGNQVGTGNSTSWQVFLQHPQVNPQVQAYGLLEGDSYWLLLDRTTRNLYVGEGKAVQTLLEQPESLALLACLDGYNSVDEESKDTLQDNLKNLQDSATLKNLIPVAVGAALIVAVGIGAWFWLKPNSLTPLNQDCGVGGSQDFSAYVTSSVGDKELHLISVYEAHSDHSSGYHPSGAIDVKVERQQKPMILALSSYEPVRWYLTLDPGVEIKRVILSGYHKQTISGADGIPVDRQDYSGGISVRNFPYASTSVYEAPENSSFVARLERMTGTRLTSALGCYRGTEFTIK